MIHLLLLLLLTLALAHPHRVTIFVLFSYASLLVDAVLAWHAHGVSARLVGLLASIHRYPHCIGYGVMVYYDAGQRIACPCTVVARAVVARIWRSKQQRLRQRRQELDSIHTAKTTTMAGRRRRKQLASNSVWLRDLVISVARVGVVESWAFVTLG